MPYLKVHYYASAGRLDEMQEQIRKEVESGRYKTIKEVIELRTDEGDTPLLCATAEGQVNVVKYLIDNHADLGIVHTSYGDFTPLHTAIFEMCDLKENATATENFLKIIKLFLKARSDLLDVVDNYAESPFAMIVAMENNLSIKKALSTLLCSVT